jgi:hypothetical protein
LIAIQGEIMGTIGVNNDNLTTTSQPERWLELGVSCPNGFFPLFQIDELLSLVLDTLPEFCQ